jgi:hypothetical protein
LVRSNIFNSFHGLRLGLYCWGKGRENLNDALLEMVGFVSEPCWDWETLYRQGDCRWGSLFFVFLLFVLFFLDYSKNKLMWLDTNSLLKRKFHFQYKNKKEVNILYGSHTFNYSSHPIITLDMTVIIFIKEFYKYRTK